MSLTSVVTYWASVGLVYGERPAHERIGWKYDFETGKDPSCCDQSCLVWMSSMPAGFPSPASFLD